MFNVTLRIKTKRKRKVLTRAKNVIMPLNLYNIILLVNAVFDITVLVRKEEKRKRTLTA